MKSRGKSSIKVRECATVPSLVRFLRGSVKLSPETRGLVGPESINVHLINVGAHVFFPFPLPGLVRRRPNPQLHQKRLKPLLKQFLDHSLEAGPRGGLP